MNLAEFAASEEERKRLEDGILRDYLQGRYDTLKGFDKENKGLMKILRTMTREDRSVMEAAE